MGQIVGLKIHELDNTATVFCENVGKDSKINIYDSKNYILDIIANQNIDYGHKIAIKDIYEGDFIIKFGEKIGIAVQNIKKGDHVHIHNIKSLRARGDLNNSLK